jgi:anthranilate phosphoribosyltransferase
MYRVRAGRAIERIDVLPGDVGFNIAPAGVLAGGTAAENAEIIKSILNGEYGPRREVVLMNAAAALIAADIATTMQEGVDMAAIAIDSGNARNTLNRLVEASRNPHVIVNNVPAKARAKQGAAA